MEKLIRLSAPGRRRTTVSDQPQGLTMRNRPYTAKPYTDLALEATLKAAAPYQNVRGRENRLILTVEDFRRRLRERRAGQSILFLIDASASMRGQDKMARVKGMIRCFLDEIYLKRDRVALVAFRHAQTELVLPFTHNLAKARTGLDRLPTGGKTPLAEGLSLAYRTLRRERCQHPRSVPILILFSDGKPNASLNGIDPLDETLAVADQIRRNRVQSLFIDTETNPLAFGSGPDIAHALGGLYVNIASLMRKAQ